MTTVYQSTRVVWPPQPYYPAQYQSSQGVAPATYEGSSRHSTQLHESQVSRRDRSERRESLRRAEQVRADEALARRVQAEEEQLLLFESMRTAQRDHRRQSLTIVRDRTPSTSTSTRPSTPRSARTTRTLSIPVEPFIPPQNVDPTSTPSPLRVSTPLPETPESLHQTSSPKTPAQVLREHARLFTKSPPCSRCGTLMPVHPILDTSTATPNTQLHLTCPRCSTTHCRGCVRPVTCPPHCSTSKTPPSSCALKTCCSRGRAIAVFELLSHFDALYTSAVAHVCNSSPTPSSPSSTSQADRALFLELLTSGADDRLTKRFNRSFLSTLQSLRSWLSPHPSPPPSHSHPSSHLHPHHHYHHRTLPALLTTSHLPSVLRAYLHDTAHAHIHWVIHAELYVEILGLLVQLGRDEDGGVRGIVMGPPGGAVRVTSGVRACVWGSHSSASASAAFSERDEDEDEDEREEGTREIDEEGEEEEESLCALAGEGRIRMDLRKMERRGDVQTQGLVAQLLMDLNHIVCMNVLS